MINEPTTSSAKESRENANRKYLEEQKKFGLQMMMMTYYKVKSLLNEQGLKKITAVDKKRSLDEAFNLEVSEQIWAKTEEIWGQALGKLMIEISNVYGLSIDKDFIVESNELID